MNQAPAAPEARAPAETDPRFMKRDCPACGHSAREVEVSSRRRAEDMPLEEVESFWENFTSENVFFSFARCGNCRLLYAPTFFTNDQLSDLYSSLPANMAVVPTDAIEATQRSYLDEVAPLAPLDGDYLEIGPDVGHLARQAARRGKFEKFWLFEPNQAVHEQLAASTEGRPNHVSTEMTDLSVVPDGSVGLAVMVHVLDHLIDPVALLRQVEKKLKPDGRVMIVTHNERSVLRKLMGNKFPPFCLQHPELYNPDTITSLLQRVGLKSVTVRRSKNYFPLAFMIRQATSIVGLKLDRLPLPKTVVGLRLGNMMTIAGR